MHEQVDLYLNEIIMKGLYSFELATLLQQMLQVSFEKRMSFKQLLKELGNYDMRLEQIKYE